MRNVAIAVAGLLLAACVVGPNIDTYGPANRVNGTQTTMRLLVGGQEVTHTGELIAVRSDDFLVLTEEGLERIPHELVQRADFASASPDDIRGAGTDRQRRSLARYSRYPQGLTQTQMDGLLAGFDQSALLEVEP